MINDNKLSKSLQKAFPSVPEGYEKKINAILKSLETKPFNRGNTSMRRFSFTPGKIVAAVLVLIIIVSCCVFAASPALAADIPVINEIVYELSNTVEPGKNVQNKITKTVQEVLSGFISNATSKIGVRFKAGDNWVLDDDTLYAAYYLHFEAALAELINKGKTPVLANVVVTNIETEQKGFRYTATLTYDILLNDKYFTTETVNAQLEETLSGLYIKSLNINSEGFETYKKNIAQYNRAENGSGKLDENIANYNAYLIAQQKAQYELAQQESAASGTELTRNERLEDLAAELCYRYWSATKIPDMADIMERNDDTELWFYALELQLQNKYRTSTAMTQKGYAKILDITERTDNLINAKVYVKTIVEGSIGQVLQLTFRSDGNRYLIVSFSSPWDDGLHRELERFAKQYTKEGMSRSEANKKAFESIRIAMLERIKELEGMKED